MFSPTKIPRKESDEFGEQILTRTVKAGRRTYFFDVRATRGNDYYLTITESRKKQMRDGSFTIDKHKIHLYKEDFQKFGEGFKEVVDYVKRERPELFNPDGSAIGSGPANASEGTSSISEDDFFKGL